MKRIALVCWLLLASAAAPVDAARPVVFVYSAQLAQALGGQYRLAVPSESEPLTSPPPCKPRLIVYRIVEGAARVFVDPLVWPLW